MGLGLCFGLGSGGLIAKAASVTLTPCLKGLASVICQSFHQACLELWFSRLGLGIRDFRFEISFKRFIRLELKQDKLCLWVAQNRAELIQGL